MPALRGALDLLTEPVKLAFGARSLQITPFKTTQGGEFPGSLGVRTLCFNCRGMGSIPGWGTKMLHAKLPKEKKLKQKPKVPTFTATPCAG